mmetsp:Transcript_8937/g.26623  ORF Transcript_8937/g.26623 Transcript_8937/m.26623 type:complete len:95 (-) Transcript_8937:426-710(-)
MMGWDGIGWDGFGSHPRVVWVRSRSIQEKLPRMRGVSASLELLLLFHFDCQYEHARNWRQCPPTIRWDDHSDPTLAPMMGHESNSLFAHRVSFG